MRRQRGEKLHADRGRGWRAVPQVQGGLEPPRPGEAGGTFSEFLRALSCDSGLSCGTRHVCRPHLPRDGPLLCGLRRHTHPLSCPPRSGSRASCSLRGASGNLQRQPHSHASVPSGGLGVCPAGEALPTGAGALAKPLTGRWGLLQGWCGPWPPGGCSSLSLSTEALDATAPPFQSLRPRLLGQLTPSVPGFLTGSGEVAP